MTETIFEKDDDHKVASTAGSLTTFAALAGLAALSLGVGFSDFGIWKVLISLLVAGVQASVLTLFFMDLRQADKLSWLCAGASLFWTSLLFLFTLTDYLTRHLAVL